jgi:hypothetical protein
MSSRSCVVVILILLVGINFSQGQSKEKLKQKKFPYQEIDFEDMIRRYFNKPAGPINTMEGIYSVSCVILTQNKVLFSKRERIKVVERKDNYARIAIVKDWPETKRDFIEISLSYRDAKRYPIVGWINLLSEGNTMIYNHIEPDAKTSSFSMAQQADLIEGEYSVVKGRKTVTYKLSYLKIYPKAESSIVNITDQ